MDRTPTASSLAFSIDGAREILERTPGVMRALLAGLGDGWTTHNEGGDTWAPYDVIGHLIHGEKTDWMERIGKCLSEDDKAFHKFDRTAMFEESRGKTLTQLLDEFAALRQANLAKFDTLGLSDLDLQRTGIHPTFGTVTLRQLLA